MVSFTPCNRHPIDELADIREKIALLKEREQALRQAILRGSCGLVGDQYKASIMTAMGKRIDTDLLRTLLTNEGLALILKPTRTIYVKTARKQDVSENKNQHEPIAAPAILAAARA